jgi:hypothetical protein
MSEEKWGIGDVSKARSFGWTRIGEKDHGALEVLYGEHPHSTSDNRLYARDDHGTIYDFDGHRILIDVVIRSYNYLKESDLSGDEVRKGGNCQILADREPIYGFFFRDPQYALLRAHGLITQLSEHSMSLLTSESRQKEIGRKVYYDRTPARIERLYLDQGCVWLVPEPGHKFAAPVWEDNPKDWESEYGGGLKADILLDGHIWWHRE